MSRYIGLKQKNRSCILIAIEQNYVGKEIGGSWENKNNIERVIKFAAQANSTTFVSLNKNILKSVMR